MTPNPTPLWNKLILLMLSLNLVCLVLLVVRNYQGQDRNREPALRVETAPPEEAMSFANTTPPPAPRRPAPVPPVRATLSSPSNPPLSAPVPAIDSAPNGQDHHAWLVHSAVAKVDVGDGHGHGSRESSSHDSGTELTGIVTLLGEPPPEIPIDLGATCGRYHSEIVTTRHYVVGPSGGLANVLVYLQDAKRQSLSTEGPALQIEGCLFEPYMMGIVVGQKFTVRNLDPGFHNVHAITDLNREYNFGLAAQGHQKEISFSKPEIFVRIRSHNHSWMSAYVGVVDHPYFAVTDTNGAFRLPGGFPAGAYNVAAVHVKAGTLFQRISINKRERKTLEFQFAVEPQVPAQNRIVRAE